MHNYKENKGDEKMRVSYNTVAMWEIDFGMAFSAKRPNSDAEDIYMRLDGANEYVLSSPNKAYGVSLLTGQLREFNIDYEVVPLNAEINVL